MLPVLALGDNDNPHLYLEVYNFMEEPSPVPEYICVHTDIPCEALHCYDVKTMYSFAYVPVHIGKLDCPEKEPPGGFLGLPFGVVVSGEAMTYVSTNACPGFMKGPSTAGEPAAIVISSTSGCHDWYDHIGYLIYLNMSTRTGASYFDIVASADVGHHKVINCQNTYDENTVIGGGGQYGGVQTIVCYGWPTNVEVTTWGKIKGLYR